MSDAWQRCRGHNDGVIAPLDQIDGIYLWAAGEVAIAARAVAALTAPLLDVPLVIGSGPHVPAWVGGATLSIVVDRLGDGAGRTLVPALIDRGGPVIGLTADVDLATVLADADQTVLDLPPAPAIIPPVAVALLEVLDAEAVVADLARWQVPGEWAGGDGLPARIAAAVADAECPGFYGSEGVGAVAASWFASQIRLFSGRAAVGASFPQALTHLPAWGPVGIQPIAWLVADPDEAAVAAAFDAAAPDVVTVACEADRPGGRLAELLALADLVAGALPGGPAGTPDH